MAEAPDDPIKAKIDHDIAQQQKNKNSGSRSIYSCPDCGGALWEFDAEFACHTGHRWSPDMLLAAQSEELRSALRAAVRLLKEQAVLLRQMADRAAAASASGRLLQAQAETDDRHAALIQTELLDDGDPPPAPDGAAPVQLNIRDDVHEPREE